LNPSSRVRIHERDSGVVMQLPAIIAGQERLQAVSPDERRGV